MENKRVSVERLAGESVFVRLAEMLSSFLWEG